MEKDRIQEYLHLLERELRKRGLSNKETLAEMESHLLDSVDQSLSRGMKPADAQQNAVDRFGAPGLVAHQFEKESNFMKQKILLISSLVLGLLIAYIDSRPTWDDTGITVLALLVGGGIIGLLVRKHPWLFAFAFGLWIPLYGIIFRHDFSMSVVLFFPFVGVYALPKGLTLHLKSGITKQILLAPNSSFGASFRLLFGKTSGTANKWGELGQFI